MLDCLTKQVRDLEPEQAQGTRLSVVPIIGPSREEPAYELLTPANLDKVQVTEISDAGSVPVLKVTNTLDVRVFLMDGQELLGAKQNRILNTDVLVPAKSTINIPVSCVEQGRWHHQGVMFSPGRSASHRIRAAKAERVRASLKAKRGHDADQHAVWEEVAATAAYASAPSATGALADAYRHREEDLAKFRTEVTLPGRTVGAAVFRRGELLGLDLFDRHATLAWFWSALADSYAIDVLADPVDVQGAGRSIESAVVRELLDHVAAGSWERFDTPGDGVDWRLDDPRYAAAALSWNDQAVLHLQVFPKRTPDAPARRTQIRRPYPRR